MNKLLHLDSMHAVQDPIALRSNTVTGCESRVPTLGLAQYAVLCLQSDASTERLLQRVVSPEEGLAAHLLWREEEERIAVEQAAMWMAQPPASSPPVLDDAMDVDRPDRTAEAASAGLFSDQSSIYKSRQCGRSVTR